MSTVFTGIPRELVKDSGGLYEVFITELSNVTGATITQATGIATFHSPAGVWKRYILGKEAGSDFVSTKTNNLTNGTSETDNVLKMIFKRNQISKRNEAMVMAKSEMVVVINDNAAPQNVTGETDMGNLFIIGLAYSINQGGAELRTGVGSSGAQFGDSNNLTITIGCKENDGPFSISPACLTAIRAGSAISAI